MDKALKKILIRTKKAVFSDKIGNNTSKFKGEGYDFVELREYEDGEDIRKIDWVISAKMQKPFVKVFLSQRELDIHLVSILGGSVHFGTSRMKQEVIAEICSFLGYSCCVQGDTFSSYIAHNKVEIQTQKTKKTLVVEEMVRKIYYYNSLGKVVDYEQISTELFSKIHKKSLIFLIGDFFQTESLSLKLLAKKHEVIVIIVRDRFEETLHEMGHVNFLDPQTFQKFEGNLDRATIEEYKKKIQFADEILYENFKNSGVDFIKIYTDENPLLKMIKLLR